MGQVSKQVDDCVDGKAHDFEFRREARMVGRLASLR
jgi:hypothetical protein